jgi:hypothetical protein
MLVFSLAVLALILLADVYLLFVRSLFRLR